MGSPGSSSGLSGPGASRSLMSRLGEAERTLIELWSARGARGPGDHARSHERAPKQPGGSSMDDEQAMW